MKIEPPFLDAKERKHADIQILVTNLEELLAMADAKYSVRVAPSELRQCNAIGDLTELVSK